MSSFLKIPLSVVLAAGFASFVHAQTPAMNPAAADGSSLAAPVSASSAPVRTGSAADPDAQKLLRDAAELSGQKKYDDALAKVNSFLEKYPKNIYALSLRGSIYSKQARWEDAQKEFESMLAVDPTLSTAKFDLSELQFMQKKYDNARPGFLLLEKDEQLSDLASYKVFLCDLLAGHTHQAQQELDTFNDAAANPSYYFANIAWSVYNKKPDDARDWLKSALRIYQPYKIQTYAATLEDLNYLPLPPLPGSGASTPDASATTNTAPATNAAPATTP